MALIRGLTDRLLWRLEEKVFLVAAIEQLLEVEFLSLLCGFLAATPTTAPGKSRPSKIRLYARS